MGVAFPMFSCSFQLTFTGMGNFKLPRLTPSDTML